MGFQFGAIGPNWGERQRRAGKADKLRPLIRALAKVGANTPSGFKRALQSSPDKYR